MCLYVFVSVSVCYAHYSAVLCPFGMPEVCRTILAMACYIPSFKKFHARVHTNSHNFTQFSGNLGYFSHFWANLKMLGIKKHILGPRHSLVILSRNFKQVFTQFHAISCKFQAIFTQFRLFQPFLGQFQHVGYQKACTPA